MITLHWSILFAGVMFSFWLGAVLTVMAARDRCRDCLEETTEILPDDRWQKTILQKNQNLN